jgi:hypothetical protein
MIQLHTLYSTHNLDIHPPLKLPLRSLPTLLALVAPSKFASRITTQCLYHAVFATFLCHDLPEDIYLPREIIKATSTTLPSLRLVTKTPQSKLNSQVA